MAEIDFEKEFADFVMGSDSSAIMEIYKIIPYLSAQQIKVINSLQYFTQKWDLEDMQKFIASYLESQRKNKNLGFLSSMNMKSLLKAYTNEEMIRGIKVQATKEV
jgi:hypothetical protein